MSFGTNQQSSTTDIVTDNLPVAAGVGAASYVVGYVLTFVFVTIDGVDSSQIDSWKFVGWVFYGGHNVDIESTASGGGMSQSETFSIFGNQAPSDLTSTIPEILYMLVPVLVLVIAGFLVYGMVGRQLDTASAAGVGASVALGYLVLSVVGIFLFEWSRSQGGASLNIGPEMTMGILLAGIVYPIVFGAIGGIVGKSASS